MPRHSRRGGGPCVGFQQLLRALGPLLLRCWRAPEAAAQESKARPATPLALAPCAALLPAWRLVSQILPLGLAQLFEARERRMVVFQAEIRHERCTAKRMGEHFVCMFQDEPWVVTQGH